MTHDHELYRSFNHEYYTVFVRRWSLVDHIAMAPLHQSWSLTRLISLSLLPKTALNGNFYVSEKLCREAAMTSIYVCTDIHDAQ